MKTSWIRPLVPVLTPHVRRAIRSLLRSQETRRPQGSPRTSPRTSPGTTRGPGSSLGNDRADPGEVVWAWVPYEEDASQGKDRPVLVLSRDGGEVLALPLTSKDHDRDAAQEAAAGRHWMDIGSGSWDARGRPSEVRLDRVVRLRDDDVRREGAALDRSVFDRVVAASERSRRRG